MFLRGLGLVGYEYHMEEIATDFWRGDRTKKLICIFLVTKNGTDMIQQNIPSNWLTDSQVFTTAKIWASQKPQYQ